MITDEKYLVYDSYYWVTWADSKETTIAFVTKWYDDVVFYTTGSDNRWNISHFINIHPVADDYEEKVQAQT